MLLGKRVRANEFCQSDAEHTLDFVVDGKLSRCIWQAYHVRHNVARARNRAVGGQLTQHMSMASIDTYLFMCFAKCSLYRGFAWLEASARKRDLPGVCAQS